MDYLIKQYSLQQGALEIEYIEEFFNEFPRRKTADALVNIKAIKVEGGCCQVR